jgi:hypothetical protein
VHPCTQHTFTVGSPNKSRLPSVAATQHPGTPQRTNTPLKCDQTCCSQRAEIHSPTDSGLAPEPKGTTPAISTLAAYCHDTQQNTPPTCDSPWAHDVIVMRFGINVDCCSVGVPHPTSHLPQHPHYLATAVRPSDCVFTTMPTHKLDSSTIRLHSCAQHNSPSQAN